MAVTASGLFVTTFLDVHDTTQLAVNYDLETHKVALFTNTITPNFSSDTAYGVAPYNANEVSGTGYTGGGQALTTTTFTESPTGSVRFDSDNPVWAGATFSNARCALVYADALGGDNALFLVSFGGDFSVTSNDFTITVPSTGWFAIDLTP